MAAPLTRTRSGAVELARTPLTRTTSGAVELTGHTNRIRYPRPNIIGLTPLVRTASGSVELRRV